MRIEILFGPQDGEQCTVPADKVSLGRGIANDFPFPYAGTMSSLHAEMLHENDRFHLVDVGNDGKGSTNGTVVLRTTGERLEIRRRNEAPPFPGDRVEIEPGDIIILGRSLWLKFLGA